MSIVIHTDDAPKAIGPYVQARRIGNMLYTSGCVAIDPHDDNHKFPDAASQMTQALKNLDAILKEAGFKREEIIKTTVFLKSMGDFQAINAVYAEFFGENKPCRTCVQAGDLPAGFLVEMEAVAIKA